MLPNVKKGYYKKNGNQLEAITKETFELSTKDKEIKEYFTTLNNDTLNLVPTKLNNITDAQAFRSFKSYREILAMSTGWNDKMQESYERLSRGE